jgi:translation initiation factor 5B
MWLLLQVILRIIPTNIFNKKNPFVLGVDVVEGTLKIGTPLCIPDSDFLQIGKVTSIQSNHKEVKSAGVGEAVAVKIDAVNDEQVHLLYGRHFDHKKLLYSSLTREGVKALKENFADELSTEDRRLLARMNKVFAEGIRHW